MTDPTQSTGTSAPTDTPASTPPATSTEAPAVAAVQQEADTVIKKVSDETIALVQRAADDAKAFVDSHLPGLQAKSVEYATNIGAKFTELFAEAKRFLDTHAGTK